MFRCKRDQLLPLIMMKRNVKEGIYYNSGEKNKMIWFNQHYVNIHYVNNINVLHAYTVLETDLQLHSI